MMKRIIAGCMTAALCAVLLLAPGVQAAEQAEQMETLGTIAAREEVIYSILDGEGAVQSVYAVNILDVTEPGAISDSGDYTEVTKLTNLRDLTYHDGRMTTVADALPNRPPNISFSSFFASSSVGTISTPLPAHRPSALST